jgi:hypothetical protein
MKETLLDGWTWLMLFAVAWFLFAYVWNSLFPGESDDD